MFHVPPPDHGFHIVLENDGLRQVGNIGRGEQKIAHNGVEGDGLQQFVDLAFHGHRTPAVNGHRQGGNGARQQLAHKRRGGEFLFRRRVGNGVVEGRIFLRPARTFRLIQILKPDVVDLMSFVQALEHFKRSDLPATSGGMQKIGFDPKNFHSLRDGRRLGRQYSVPPLIAFAGDENIAPQLQIQQPPEPVSGVFLVGQMAVNQWL